MRAAPVPMTAAQAHRHATALREDPRAANPADWHVDWADGPWPVKVHSGGRRHPIHDPALSRLLRHTFGITRARVADRRAAGQPALGTRRAIPSGGSMYPTEAYLVSTGVAYHYDPYRHELVDLGTEVPAWEAPVSLVLTNRFWKNFYKYGEFAYRLGAVDVGVALGRALRLAEAEYGEVTVDVDFTDAVVDACLGIDGRDEATYAVLALGGDPLPSAQAPRWAPAVVERSALVRRSDRFAAMHAAARQAPDATLRLTRPHPDGDGPPPVGPVLRLPPATRADLLDPATMVARTSNGALFTGTNATADSLATILADAAAAVDRVRVATGGALGADVGLCCAVHRVDGLPCGWYRYRPHAHDLVAVGVGTGDDSARELQEALFADTVNIELAAFTVHVTAATDHRTAARGARGYREQQMAVGVAVEALTLTAAAVGLGSHPLLGFDVGRVDKAYALDGTDRGAHAQVCVGAVRPDLAWEVTVNPS